MVADAQHTDGIGDTAVLKTPPGGGDGDEDTDTSPPSIATLGPITAKSNASGFEGLKVKQLKYP